MRISDWSSDVCSSDLQGADMGGNGLDVEAFQVSEGFMQQVGAEVVCITVLEAPRVRLHHIVGWCRPGHRRSTAGGAGSEGRLAPLVPCQNGVVAGRTEARRVGKACVRWRINPGW